MAFRITVVGLGLIGGSMAMALRGFRDAYIIGINRSEAPLREALDRGIIDEGYPMREIVAQKALGSSDLVIIALQPYACLQFLKDYSGYFRRGCVVTDVTGVKQAVVQHAIKVLSEGVDFVGGHPMAGREVSGLESAISTLFDGCNYVVTPHEGNLQGSIELVREMAYYVGAARFTIATPEVHDRMIAYTSQMAHALASAVVNSGDLFESKGFEGGSFRDITRVATLDNEMWSDLFILNGDALCAVLGELEGNLSKMRGMIESRDKAALSEFLKSTDARKKEWKTWGESR